MKRLFRWTFNILAAISTALLIYVVGNLASHALSDRVWLQVYADNPQVFFPVIVFSILPLAWFIVTAQRWRTRTSKGFDVAVASQSEPHESRAE